MKTSLLLLALSLAILLPQCLSGQNKRVKPGSSHKNPVVIEDTIVVRVFSFDDPSPTGWAVPYRGKAIFPDDGQTYRKILMIQHLKCDPRTNHDSFPCGEWDYHTQYLIKVPKYDTSETYELASFITPYGIRLNMGGEKGWQWVYDVTDYSPLLRGEREITAGNNQELLDLRFLFIKGQPARQCLEVQNIYPTGLYNYEQLSDDSVLRDVRVALHPDATAYLVKARISGHGHEGPRNCCEWDRKTHSYTINGEDLLRWEVWKDCGFNPIYPQGGTWPFDRAGWCPGTPVDEYSFELTDLVGSADSLRIDYGIEPYRENGEKKGEFRMAHQLFSYTAPFFNRDAEIVEILSPSISDSYSRTNPECGRASIIIRNGGAEPLRSVQIQYGIPGTAPKVFEWSGNLPFLHKEVVNLGFQEMHNYPGRKFNVQLSKPNGAEDQNPFNDAMTSEIPSYPILPGEFSIELHTNNLGRAIELHLRLFSSSGQLILDRSGFPDDSTFTWPVSLSPGCYELVLEDAKQDGMMRHWWYRRSEPERVGINGTLRLIGTDKKILKEFPADFGEKLLFRFALE